jgi:hypothetical protein
MILNRLLVPNYMNNFYDKVLVNADKKNNDSYEYYDAHINQSVHFDRIPVIISNFIIRISSFQDRYSPEPLISTSRLIKNILRAERNLT